MRNRTLPGRESIDKTKPPFAPGQKTPEINCPEEELKRALEWQEAIIEGSRDAIFISSADSRFIRVNQAACELTGYCRETLLTMSIPDLHEDIDLKAYRQYHQRILSGEEIISEARILRRDGSKVAAEFNNRRIVIAGEPYMHTVARDVTERKLIAESQRQNEERFRRVFEDGPLGMALVCKEGRLLRVNNMMCQMLGYSEHELIRKHFIDITHPDDTAASLDLLRKLSEGEHQHLHIEKRYLKKDGGLIWAATTVSALKDAAGKIAFQLAMIEDITERKQAVQSLLQDQQRLELLNRIATGIASGMTVDEVIECTLGCLSAFFPNFRVAYSTINSRSKLKVIRSIEPDGMPALDGAATDLKEVPEYLNELRAGKAAAVEEVASDARLQPIASILAEGQTKAMLDVPLRHSKFLVGLLCFDSPTRHPWSQHEITTLRQVADYLNVALREANSQQKRKKTEKALRESERRFRMLAEATLEGIVISKDGKILDANDQYARIFGYETHEVIGKIATDLIASEDLDLVLSKNRSESEHPYEVRGITKDDRTIDIELQSRSIPYKAKKARVTSVRDVTEGKRAQQALTESERRFQELIERIPDGIYRASQDGKFLMVNSALVSMLGYESPDELLGKEIPAALRNKPEPQTYSRKSERQTRKKAVIHFTRKDGKEVWLEDHGRVQYDPEGKPIYYEGVLRDITDRQLAEEKYRLVVENANDAILVAQDGVLKFFNKKVLQETGYSEKKLLSRSFLEWVHPDDRAALEDRHIRRLRGERLPPEHEFRFFDKRGNLKWARINSVLIHWDRKPATLNFLSDITEKKRIAEIQHRREKRFRKQQRALVKLATKKANNEENINKVLQRISETAARTLEVERVAIWLHNEDKTRLCCVEIFELSKGRHSKDGELASDEYRAYFKTLQTDRFLDVTQVRNDPRTREFSHSYFSKLGITSVLNAPVRLGGRVVGVICHEHVGRSRKWHIDEKNFASSIADMVALALEHSERTQTQQALLESERRFRDLFDDAPDIYIILEPNGKIRDFNQRGLLALGLTHEQVLGKSVTDFIHPEDLGTAAKVMEHIQKFGRPPRSVEIRLLDGNQKAIWVSKEFSLSKSENGDIQAIRVVCRNITERKQLQEELARSQRLETAGRVAGQIAHDFNNLLTPLTAYPILIRDELPEDHPVLSLIEEMQSAANRIAEINQQLLALGRRGHYSMEAVDLNDLIEKTLASLKPTQNLVVQKDLASELFLIKGGAAQLMRALTNMLINSVEAMDGIGVLKLKSQNVYLDEPLRGYQTIARGEYVKLEITDSGTGIDPEILDKIFEPFFSTKKMDRVRGSGLGLSVVHGVMEDHNGYITVQTEIGQGTTFALYFPAVRDATLRIEPAAAITKGANEKILFVDDDEVQRRVVKQLLGRLGYRVETLASGEEAIDFVRDHPQDLIILDMVMEGIDGSETYREILNFRPQQKAIFLSGYAVSHKVQEALRMGAGCFLSKPVNFNKLALAVRRELGGHGGN